MCICNIYIFAFEGENECGVFVYVCVCAPKVDIRCLPQSSVFIEAGILACQMSPFLTDFAINAGKSKLGPYSCMTATSTKPSLL